MDLPRNIYVNETITVKISVSALNVEQEAKVIGRIKEKQVVTVLHLYVRYVEEGLRRFGSIGTTWTANLYPVGLGGLNEWEWQKNGSLKV